ncbi:MAG TPA: DUF5916 domain-containing protein [Vicinamibacterales bacterium]|nr:DUF5916 domain-containing protein [Vicinamibacterales bacterium]
MNRTVFFLSFLCLLGLGTETSGGQRPVVARTPPRQTSAGQAPVGQPDAPTKQARATRVPGGAVRLDGKLDEAFWERAEPITEFTQAEPNEGGTPTDRMEVRFVYDDTALWIGARMRSDAGGPIQAPMSRRDSGDQAEYLEVELDTYHDRRTAYMFGVTASGVRLDHFHPTDNQDDVDAEFDPVWQAKTTIDAGGWTAEMWLPFSQLRFNDTPERVWGLNLKRWRPTLNEEDYWVVVGRTARGWSSRFGELRGIEGVAPKARLEVLPYVSGSSRVTSENDPRNPFDSGANPGGSVGADMKIGIGSNLTLEATINPDFGQVEADPAEVNLTVFETTFPEKRPFFIEGNNILEAGTSNYYYSRRIGARPAGAATGEYVDYPQNTTILGAAKLTGRFSNGLSVGFLGAVTDEESARVSIRNLRSDVPVAPRTEWGVGRAIKQLGRDSTLGAHVTLVHREMEEGTLLASSLVRSALTTGIDTRLRFKDRTYEASGNIGLTFLNGDAAAMARVQRASGHYLNRLDQPAIRYDPSRTDLNGAQVVGNLSKIAGRHWLWSNNIMIESPEFDPLDFGRLNYAGDITTNHRLTYRETRPGKYLRAYSSQWAVVPYWYYDLDLGVRYNVQSNNSATFRNFWVSSVNVTRFFRGNDAQMTRGGPAMGSPLGWAWSASLRNSTGAATAWTASVNRRSNEFGDHTMTTSVSLSARPTPSLQFSINPEFADENGTSSTFSGPINRQYLTTLDGGKPENYGKRYIFGVVDRTTFSAQFRVSYTFKPDVTLDVYAEPFAASGRYSAYGEMLAPRNMNLRMYGTDGTTIARQPDGSYRVTDGASAFTLANRDFNTRSYRSNVVLKWEWRPGSTLYVVWQQNRASQTTDGEHVGVSDLFDSWSAPGDNIFLVKSTLWLSR